ncbi:MAG: beta strand repeat-containing protein, partial [Gemmataceae bacterium]
TITLGSAALPTIAATTGAGSLTITGPGASSLIISGNNGSGGRDFSIFNIASGGNLSISGVTVSGAKTTNNGAGFSNLGTLTVSNSLITGNSGGNTGGGIFSTGTLTVSGSTFTGNSANYGGGLYISKWSSFGTVTNSTFSNNTAFRHGGGLFNNGTLTITNTTVSGNTSIDAQYGAGLHSNATVYIANTIIANNINGLDYYGTANLISPATASSNLVTQSGLAWATTVTSAQLNLGPLQNNGGPTSTMALGAGSVAIAAGNSTISNASPVNGLDQRGVTRIASDIGAYAVSNQIVNQITVTTTADTISSTDGVTSLREAITLANTTPGNDVISFNFTGLNTITLGSALPTIVSASTGVGSGTAGSLTIAGPGASSLVISGNNQFDIFSIASDGNLSISGVTVSGAKTANNGGAFNNAGSLAVSNSLITGNTAAGGGGIFNTGNLNVSNSTFSNNSTTSQNGGAVWNYGGSANTSILNSTISSNTATTSSGGGIGNTGGTVTLSNSTLFANQASGGGGIFNNANGTFTIFNSTISNNSATTGGGIHIGSGTLNISNTIIAN